MKKQNAKDRHDESVGMKRYERDHMDSGYSYMLSEDKSAPANLPQEVKHTYYPKCKYMGRYELDDSMKGLDEVRDYDIRKIESEASDSKW